MAICQRCRFVCRPVFHSLVVNTNIVRDFSLNEDFHSFFLTGLFLARPQVKIVRQKKKIVEKRITAVPFYQKKKVKQIDLFYRLIEIFGVTSLFFCLMEIAVKRNL